MYVSVRETKSEERESRREREWKDGGRKGGDGANEDMRREGMMTAKSKEHSMTVYHAI